MLKNFFHFFLFQIFAFIIAKADESDLIKNTLNGFVNGYSYELTIEDQRKTVNAWLGIPFAEPPVKDLRFKRPVYISNWDGVLNATMKKSHCRQSEDCLYLNIYSPGQRSNEKRPVLLYLHGGGFVDGSPYSLDPSVLISETNILYVSVAYRLSLFGFLFTDDIESPGNMGLLDQAMAIEWIYNNIEFFGGDKTRITIFGQSAGAKSVGLHLLSNVSSKHFRNAILNSGSPLADFVITDKYESIERNLKFLKFIGCEKDDVKESIQCARNIEMDVLLKKSSEFEKSLSQYISEPDPPFSPVIDGYFLEDEPIALLESGKFKHCSIITGSNQNEGNLFLKSMFKDKYESETAPQFNFTTFKQILTSYFYYYPKYPITTLNSITEALLYRYTNWSNPNNYYSILENIDHSVGDFNYLCPAIKFLDFFAENKLDVYQYYNVHMNSKSTNPKWLGVLHGDELKFIYGLPFYSKGFTEEEKNFSKKLMTYWSNFVKYDNPNGLEKLFEVWPKYNVSNSPDENNYQKSYLIFQPETFQVGFSLRADYCSFWNTFLPNLLQSNNGAASIFKLTINPTVYFILIINSLFLF